MLGDAPAVRQDLRALGVLLGRDVAELLEQRHVHVRLDVTGDARVAVPVPGAAHVGRLVDQPHAVDAELAQPRARQQSAEAGTDDRHVDLVGQRLRDRTARPPMGLRRIRETAGDLDVLRDPVRPQPAFALLGVLPPQRIDIQRLDSYTAGTSMIGRCTPAPGPSKCHHSPE